MPAVVGPGLKKNALFDIKHNNQINKIDSRSKYQFYPTVNLWRDLVTSTKLNIDTVHLTAEPVSIKDIIKNCFLKNFHNEINDNFPNYDFRSKFASKMTGNNYYQYSKNDVFHAVRSYDQYSK